MAYKISQGDQRMVPFDIKLNGEILTPDDLTELEICAAEGAFRKLLSSGEVAYDYDNSHWAFLLKQEETLAMEPGTYNVQARPVWSDGTIIMTSIGTIQVADANSEEVI